VTESDINIWYLIETFRFFDKMNLRERHCEVGRWVKLVQDRVQYN